MQKFILIVLMLALSSCREDDNAHIQQRLNEAQAQPAQQSARAGTWQTVATVLGIGCVVFLLIGAAAGSKTRRSFHDETDK